MAKINLNVKWASFRYDFAADGGAAGTIGMGVYIPNNCIVMFGYAKVTTALTSGGAMNASVGWTGDTAALIGVTAKADWSINAVLEGVDLIVAMVEATANRELAVTIDTNDGTAGVFEYICQYVEHDA